MHDSHTLQIPLSKQEVALYVVATPIGNFEDISLRAITVLAGVDVVLCEDTRVTGKLLSHWNIGNKLLVYNDHSDVNARKKIIAMLKDGKSVALVSDAGTPLISDPGYKLVMHVYDEGLRVVSVPGASAVMVALCLSGLPTDRFYFEGFLPSRKEARCNVLSGLIDVKSTLIFYESPRRLVASLQDMSFVLGDRDVAVLREMTKKYEEVKRGKFTDVIDYYKNNIVKGEVVIVVSASVEREIGAEELKKQLRKLLDDMSLRDAVELVSEVNNVNKKNVYKLALKLG